MHFENWLFDIQTASRTGRKRIAQSHHGIIQKGVLNLGEINSKFSFEFWPVCKVRQKFSLETGSKVNLVAYCRKSFM